MDYSKFTVTFSSDGIPDVTVLLDQNPAQIMGGYGGWQVTSREHRLGLTQWRGNDPVRIAIPILFDHAINKICNQSQAMRNLMLMGRPPGINHGEPPIITVAGNIPVATGKGASQEWVIENVQWGTNRVLDDDVPIRQDAIVNLLESIDADRVAFANIALPSINPKKHKKDKGQGSTSVTTGNQSGVPGWPKWYTVLPGDTLPKIAAKFYHDSSMWHRIADANNIRDPRMLFTFLFSKIRIPAP